MFKKWMVPLGVILFAITLLAIALSAANYYQEKKRTSLPYLLFPNGKKGYIETEVRFNEYYVVTLEFEGKDIIEIIGNPDDYKNFKNLGDRRLGTEIKIGGYSLKTIEYEIIQRIKENEFKISKRDTRPYFEEIGELEEKLIGFSQEFHLKGKIHKWAEFHNYKILQPIFNQPN